MGGILVGRAAELAAIDAASAAGAASGRPTVIAISGAAGLGKTRLLERDPGVVGRRPQGRSGRLRAGTVGAVRGRTTADRCDARLRPGSSGQSAARGRRRSPRVMARPRSPLRGHASSPARSRPCPAHPRRCPVDGRGIDGALPLRAPSRGGLALEAGDGDLRAPSRGRRRVPGSSIAGRGRPRALRADRAHAARAERRGRAEVMSLAPRTSAIGQRSCGPSPEEDCCSG